MHFVVLFQHYCKMHQQAGKEKFTLQAKIQEKDYENNCKELGKLLLLKYFAGYDSFFCMSRY